MAEKVLEIIRLQKNRMKIIVSEGQQKENIRNDIDCEQIVDIIIGIAGNTVREWMVHSREADIVAKGKETIECIKKLIKK